MSKPNLPPLPPVPPETIIHQGHVLHQRYGQDEEALRAWATAYAEQAVRQALEAQATALRAFADRKYCIAIDFARRNEALGWESKVKSGRFGADEYACHKHMNEAYGAHFGIYEALKQSTPSQEPPCSPTSSTGASQ